MGGPRFAMRGKLFRVASRDQGIQGKFFRQMEI
jgi:hypothetical protein